MREVNEQQLRQQLADLFVHEYIPILRAEFERFSRESFEREAMLIGLADIVGHPMSMVVGKLKIAEPTNKLIDKIVKLYVEEKAG